MLENILLTLAGGVIGFVSSLGLYLAQHLIKRIGKIKIYYKILDEDLNENVFCKYGFNISQSHTLSFSIPIKFEILNTSNTSRVLRDINISLFKNNELKVERMTQIENIKTKTYKGDKVSEYDEIENGDKGGYSFIIPPHTIQKYKCLFYCKRSDFKENSLDVNKIVLQYYNEKDIPISYEIDMLKIDEQNEYITLKEWTLAKKLKK